MAQPKNRQQFVELEYCFEQYFNKNFAPIVNREYDELNKKQLEEYSRTLDRHQASVGMFGGAYTAALMAYQEHKTVGEWGSKSSDYLLEECNKKFSADPKVQEDLSKMVIACRATLVSELGTEKYKEMSAGTPTGDLANFYVCNRFITLFMEQLAKKEMPKGALDYIMKKGVADSLPGLLVGCTMKSSDMDKQIKDMSEKFYKPSGGEKTAAFGISFLLDAASTGGYGSAGKAATWLAVDGGLHLVGSVIPKDKSFDQMMGEAVWGNGKAIDGIRADRLGERYARERGYQIQRFPADWDGDGSSAGPIRNAKMADNAHALIAFWDGHSRGTKNMIETAASKGPMVRAINYKNINMQQKNNEKDAVIEKLRIATADLAVKHIKEGNGLKELNEKFNEYYNSISTPGVRISRESDLATETTDRAVGSTVAHSSIIVEDGYDSEQQAYLAHREFQSRFR